MEPLNWPNGNQGTKDVAGSDFAKPHNFVNSASNDQEAGANGIHETRKCTLCWPAYTERLSNDEALLSTPCPENEQKAAFHFSIG